MAIECGPTVLVTLVSVGVGGLIAHLSSSGIARLNARLAAGAKLRTAFAPELAELRLGRIYKDFTDVERLLNEAFPGHAAAIEEYRFFVRPKDRAAYQQAWEEYFKQGESKFLLQYALGENAEEPHELSALFEQRVQAIFRFTDGGC